MSTEFENLEKLGQSGTSPSELDRLAKAAHLQFGERILLLRKTYGMSLVEAKEIKTFTDTGRTLDEHQARFVEPLSRFLEEEALNQVADGQMERCGSKTATRSSETSGDLLVQVINELEAIDAYISTVLTGADGFRIRAQAPGRMVFLYVRYKNATQEIKVRRRRGFVTRTLWKCKLHSSPNKEIAKRVSSALN